jgi:chemotaxis-related protein WspD
MKQPLSLLSSSDCWNRIGIWGDRSCPELPGYVHCHNCPVFAKAGQQFLDAPSPAGYLSEWRDRLAALIEASDNDLRTVLIFRIGEEWLALSVQVLVEVTSLRPVHRVPHRTGLLAGMVNIRGELQLCAKLAEMLGIQEATPALAPDRVANLQRMLVVRHEAERWVLPVDGVEQVHRFPAAALTRAPSTVGRAVSHLTFGVFTWQGRAVGFLDEGRLFQALKTRVLR